MGSFYRSVLAKASLMLASMVPGDFLVDERRVIQEKKGTGCNSPGALVQLKDEIRRSSLDKWQSRWSGNTGCGAWTKHLHNVRV